MALAKSRDSLTRWLNSFTERVSFRDLVMSASEGRRTKSGGQWGPSRASEAGSALHPWDQTICRSPVMPPSLLSSGPQLALCFLPTRQPHQCESHPRTRPPRALLDKSTEMVLRPVNFVNRATSYLRKLASAVYASLPKSCNSPRSF